MKTFAEKINNLGLSTIYHVNNVLGLFGKLQTKPAVLCYHGIDTGSWRFSFTIEEFTKQMKYLQEKKKIVPLSAIVNGNPKKMQNCVALTFDDGYEDLLAVAPILQKLGIPATLFVLGEAKRANRRELDNEKKLLSKAQVKQLHTMGWEIGFHTATHANLWEVSDEALEDEIVQGKYQLEKQLGITMNYFAYPRGLYSGKIISFVKRAGFQAAFTVDGGAINYEENKLIMRRIGMESLMTGRKFEALLSPLGLGFEKFYMDILRMKEKVSHASFWKAATLPESLWYLLRTTKRDAGPRQHDEDSALPLNPLNITILDFDDIRNLLLGAGQASATYEVGKRLVAKGHTVTVISSKYSGYKDRIEEGITYKHIGIGTSNIKLNNLIYIARVPFVVRKLQADIVVECFTAPISTLLSPLFTKIPVVALPSSFEAERFSKLYHLPFHLIERYGARVYKYHLPLSDYNDQKMKRLNKQIIAKIVPEGVSEGFFSIQKKASKHILFLGRFDMGQKGIDLLLQAYKKVADKLGIPLVIAGHGPDEQKIRSLIEQLGLQERVALVGPAYGKKKEQLLAETVAVTLPSRNESFSCFALEALASGAPLVTFKIPGLSWLTDMCAFRVEAFNVDAYAKALLQTKNQEKINIMGKNARLHARKFTWDRVVDEYLSFFYEVLERESKLSFRAKPRYVHETERTEESHTLVISNIVRNLNILVDEIYRLGSR